MVLLRVVRTVAADGVDRHVGGDLIEQLGQHVGIANVLMRYQSRAYLPGLGVHRQMHLSPNASLGVAALAYLPLVFPVKLYARAVGDKMQRLAAAQRGQHHVEWLRATAQSRVVRHWQSANIRRGPSSRRTFALFGTLLQRGTFQAGSAT